ncbi:MAG: GNAT family N-acetyltransferase [Actinomycetota bacterium]
MEAREIARDDRVVLREFVDGDIGDLLAVLGDPEVMRYSTSGAVTITECREFVVANRIESARTGLGAWVVGAADDPTLLGYCRLRSEAETEWIGEGEIEIGYRLARRAWGHGYATAAAALARDLAFERHGAATLIAVIDPANEASVAVAARLGMTPARELMLPEYDHPDIVHELTVEAWRELSR